MKKILKRMIRTYMVILPLSVVTILIALPSGVQAQFAIAEVIKAGVKKVIKAVDLKVQRLQNETIWLQNAQKVLENTSSKLELAEISDWTKRQQELYADYYLKLWEVKSMIAAYQRVKDLAETQAAIVKEYNWAFALFTKDKHFSSEELLHMQQVYRGILDASIANLDQVFVVISSFKTQMSDGARLELISTAASSMDQNYADLRRFNQQNITLSLQRAKSELEVKSLKQVYELN